jgi:hypothetical protein
MIAMQLSPVHNNQIQKVKNNTKASEGEVIRVKVLEYLGAGKLVIELKGQRVVADSEFLLEANQELDVIVKSTDNNKIVLQILPEDQLKPNSQIENYQHLCFSIPVLFDEEEVTSLVEFYNPKDEYNNGCGLVIRLELQKLGFLEFTAIISDVDIKCQIKSDNYKTYILAQKYVNELRKNLAKLGYNVDNINLMMQNPTDIKRGINLVDTSV